MKRYLVVVSILLALALVAACAPAPAPAAPAKETVIQQVPVTVTPPPAGPVTITFWSSYSADVEQPVLEQKIVPAFEESHPNIKIKVQQIPTDDFHRKLLTAIAGGTAPDVIRCDIVWVPELADMGALVPLDTAMADFATLKGKVFEGPLATNLLNGHYYGLPLDTNTRVLIYREDVLKAAGIQGPPKTMDEFVEACREFKATGKNQYGFADGGTYAWAVNPWIWSFGGDVTDAEVTKATGTLNGPDTIAAYTFLNDMVKNEYIHPGIKGGGVDVWGGFAKGEIAFILDGPWLPPFFAKQYPDMKLSYALMPAGKGGSVSVVGGEDIVMFQQCKNKDAAAEFVRYMLSPEAQMIMAEVGQIPVLKELTTNDTIKKHPFFGYFMEQLKTAKARTPHPAWPKMEDVLTQAGQAILQGGQTPKEALDAAAAKIDGLLGAK